MNTLPIVQLEILVVEDHKETRAALQRILQRWGHNVHFARTLRQAYQCLSESEFDVILLDIMLPDGEGFELLERAVIGRAYVVVVSAWQTEENMFKASAHGCREFLLKPHGIERLGACIGQAMRERAAAQT